VSVIGPGSTPPAFTLRREDGERFTERDLRGKGTVLVFYPFAFAYVNQDTHA
jgi:peroxiredoxin